MTDPSTASPEDLELASAYLDGEVTPEERARVEEDARLRALAAELGRLQAGLRLDDPPPALTDEHVAAALAAAGSAGAPTGPRTVTDIAAERRRRRWFERVPLGAVAAVVLLVALVGALSTIDTTDDDSAETAADSASDDASSGTDEAGEASTTAAAGTYDAAEEAAPAPSAARLDFATYDDLADHVAATVLVRPADGTAGAGAGGSTDDAADADDGEGTANELRICDAADAAGVDDPLAVVDATVDGREVTGFVVDAADGRRLLVVDRATCAVVDERDLPE